MVRPHDDIDADLARWTDIVARMGRSIEGLTQDPMFLRLKAQGRIGALSGATKARSDATVRAAEQLWALYLTLDRLLIEASELRQSNNPFSRDERFDKIDAILTGPSASLPGQPIGLAQMRLAGASDRRASFAQVFTAMDAAFNIARDTVLAASRGWSNQRDLSVYRDKISAIKADAEALGCAYPPMLDSASKRIDAAAANIDADPIGADDAAADIETMISSADQALASSRGDLAEARAFLAAAERRLTEIAALYDEATKRRADRLLKIKAPSPLSTLLADPTADLRSWLDTLAQTVTEGRPRAALVGAKSWTARADGAVDDIHAAGSEDQGLLDLRRDLRGRFSALTAKAEARKAQGRLGPEIVALFEETRALLFGAATPMPEAVALLRRCELI
jgi:hypothetical protein